MGSWQLEEKTEEQQAQAVASELGISREDLDLLDWEIEEDRSSEGLLYGHIIHFRDTSHDAILSGIKGLVGGNSVRIGLLAHDEESEPESS